MNTFSIHSVVNIYETWYIVFDIYFPNIGFLYKTIFNTYPINELYDSRRLRDGKEKERKVNQYDKKLNETRKVVLSSHLS